MSGNAAIKIEDKDIKLCRPLTPPYVLACTAIFFERFVNRKCSFVIYTEYLITACCIRQSTVSGMPEFLYLRLTRLSQQRKP